ncbi:MAG: ribbon-helix-helix protein, CopG family [Acidimicrobiales bacterium]|nr:ribbon-helix-helix protein, CopG family [Acidimicrobiales bacterium]
MRRTQIYLTEEQDDELKRLAEARHESKASVIRAIIDRALGADIGVDEDRSVLLDTAGICADYPDWPEWLEAVRGSSAADRLTGLGL